MLTIGLTGGYACGKSTVARFLAGLGAVTVDADKLAHDCLGKSARDEAIGAFGHAILNADGGIDRAALGRIVFARPEARKRLEEIIHPKVIAAMGSAMEAARKDGAQVFVFEAPLLFEAGLAGGFDRVWVVSSSPERQLQRAMARDNLPRAQAEARLAAQMPLEEKEKRADLVIGNEGDLDDLYRRVRGAWEELAES